MPERSSKRPRDPNQLAKLIVDIAPDEVGLTGPQPDDGKNPAVVALGTLGGIKGDKATARKLTAAKRKVARRQRDSPGGGRA